MDEQAWKKLRQYVCSQQKEWQDTNLNKEGRMLAAGMDAAYGGILRMMDKLEESATTREP